MIFPAVRYIAGSDQTKGETLAYMKPCWIFGGAPINGELMIEPARDSYIIAADSGYSLAVRMGFRPDLTVGDFDSLTGEKPSFGEIISVNAEKDDTDTSLAVKKALDLGYRDIFITGAIGGRLDHTIANIQTLAYIKAHGGHGRLVGERDTAEIIGEGTYSFKRIDEAYFSVFSYGGSSCVTISGVKYPLERYTLVNTFPLGVSNEITSQECSITVISGEILVIFSKK